MASESGSGVLEGDTPNVDIQVTTDVCLTKTNFESSGNSEGTKITIVTDLNAVIKGTRSTNKCNVGGESSIDYPDDVPVLDDNFNQPVVRRSRKCTNLYETQNIETFIEKDKFEINRSILLPYRGCTYYRNDPAKKEDFGKSSKSWETIKNLNNNTLNYSILKCKSVNKTSSFFNHANEQYQYLKGGGLPVNQSENLKFSFSHCGSDSLLHCPRLLDYDIVSPSNVDGKFYLHMQGNNMKKEALYNNIDGFDKEIYTPKVQNYPIKATRNVSILHRPRTREKATSTTSLYYETNLKQSLHNTIKGMLLPYMAPGKEFPSEIVLQLATKKEISECKKDKRNLIGVMEFESDYTVDNLLMPVKSSQHQKQKNKWNIFGKFLSKSKNKKSRNSQTKNICNDWENIEKEIYYPSIVEVHTKKKTKKCEF